MKLLVTGGTVFASRAAAEFMADAGHEVFVLNRGTRPQPKGVTLIRADRHLLRDELKTHCFDAVLDMTAYTAEDVRDLLGGLGEFGTYILMSSSAVYPETLPQPFTEEMQTGENIHWGTYGTGKIAAESELLQHTQDCCIIRPPYLCGAYGGGADNLYRAAFVFDCAERGLPFYLPENCALTLQFSDIGDVCALMEQVLSRTPADRKPQPRIFNTGYAEPVSAEEWVRLCYEIAGKPCEIRRVPADVPLRAYFPFRDYSYTLDVTRQNAVAPPKTTLRASLSHYLEVLRSHRPDIAEKPYLAYISGHFGH